MLERICVVSQTLAVTKIHSKNKKEAGVLYRRVAAQTERCNFAVLANWLISAKHLATP